MMSHTECLFLVFIGITLVSVSTLYSGVLDVTIWEILPILIVMGMGAFTLGWGAAILAATSSRFNVACW
jgi:hypothetical protein